MMFFTVLPGRSEIFMRKAPETNLRFVRLGLNHLSL
jgi:hypothetical protein